MLDFDSHDLIQIISSFLGAFFAFVFFIVGEYLLTKQRTRKAVLDELFAMKYYFAGLLYFFEMNLLYHRTIVEELKYDSITIQRINAFPLRETSWQSLKHLKVSSSIEYFLIHLKVLNQEIDTYNKVLDIYSRIAEVATVENRKSEFEQSMAENIHRFKVNKEHLAESFSSNKQKLIAVIDEVDFSLNYLQYNFPKRLYYHFRIKMDPSFRDLCIQKAHDYKMKQ